MTNKKVPSHCFDEDKFEEIYHRIDPLNTEKTPLVILERMFTFLTSELTKRPMQMPMEMESQI